MMIKTIPMILLTALLMIGCTEKENNEYRTIDQIQEVEGIPVQVTEIDLQNFVINYKYSANLSGIKETTVNSSVAGRVEEIFVKVGDYVETDQILLTFPEDNPMGQYTQAKAVYENNLANYERMKTLFEAGGISRSDLEQLETGLTISKANYETASNSIKVKAPFPGYVTKVFVRETEPAGMGEPLTTITVLDKYKAKVWVTEDELNDIRINSQAIATWQGNILSGRVVQVSRSMDINRQAFIVDLEFNNPNRLEVSGVLATIDITAYRNNKSIVIPRQYIHSITENSGYVYLVVNNEARRRELTLGKSDGLSFEIIDGLTVGDRLITQGTDSVTDGSLIRVVSN